MFIDYVALMLINLTAALTITALYGVYGVDDVDQRRWVPGFLISGMVALITGLGMIFAWPLPGVYNIAFGELSVLLGAILVGTGFSLIYGWSLLTVAIYAAFGGLASVVVGIGFLARGLSQSPTLAGLGYILTGLGGMLSLGAWHFRANRGIRLAVAAIVAVAAVIWAITGYGAYWTHLGSFQKWVPLPMRP